MGLKLESCFAFILMFVGMKLCMHVYVTPFSISSINLFSHVKCKYIVTFSLRNFFFVRNPKFNFKTGNKFTQLDVFIRPEADV